MHVPEVLVGFWQRSMKLAVQSDGTKSAFFTAVKLPGTDDGFLLRSSPRERISTRDIGMMPTFPCSDGAPA
jgi:hypothetical protein